MTTVQERPYLGKCKDCDFALSALPDQILPGESMKDVRAGEAPRRLGDFGVFGRCPNRHVVFRLKQIKGTYSAGRKCDSRCLNAKGDECTCECGGINHGRGHAVQVFTLHSPQPAPVKSPPSGSWRDEPMTEKQRIRIDRMLGARVMAPEARIEARRQFDNSHDWTKGKASDWITRLEELPEI